MLRSAHSVPMCQGTSETGNVSHLSAHRTPADLRNGCSRGWVPAECLEQKMRRKLSSHFAQVLLYIYNKRVTWRAGVSRSVPLDKERDLGQVRLGPASRPGPQPPGVRLRQRMVHRGIIGEIQAKGRTFP